VDQLAVEVDEVVPGGREDEVHIILGTVSCESHSVGCPVACRVDLVAPLRSLPARLGLRVRCLLHEIPAVLGDIGSDLLAQRVLVVAARDSIEHGHRLALGASGDAECLGLLGH
jgi:hypothetical protein